MNDLDLTSSCFQGEEKAREYLEKVRWPDGPVCPHCGVIDNNRIYRLNGKSHRNGLWKCGHCKEQFSVTVGTLFERSHVPLHKWLLAAYLLCSSKKGMSSHQLHRMLHVTYKTAWFMTHRIRVAMADPVFDRKLGGRGKVVEVDETFWGNKGKLPKGARGYAHQEKIFSLVERKGKVRSFHVKRVTADSLQGVMSEQIHKDSRIMTDDFKSYRRLTERFDNHSIVRHSKKEYTRGPIHTNTIENYFSILKRGLNGIYQHVGANHLKRYIGEFDFRYNTRKLNDIQRSESALQGIEGKRLMYA